MAHSDGTIYMPFHTSKRPVLLADIILRPVVARDVPVQTKSGERRAQIS